MKRKSRSRREARESPRQGTWARLSLRQVGVVAGVLLLIGAVLFLKTRQRPAASADPVATEPTAPPEQAIPTASQSGSSTSAGWATAEAASAGASSGTEDLSPEAQLDRLLSARKPVFLFFHSNTCVQCVRMTGIVEEVYPDYSDSVALVDVNVYDERNRSLLQRASIRAIPTLIFVDREGEVEGHVGVLEADALRQQLAKMGEE
ncbi:MAG: thioredoxin family protein [Chloroflexota bacterium]|nr:thioredoxin family protein [Chloroflexota bacterium]